MRWRRLGRGRLRRPASTTAEAWSWPATQPATEVPARVATQPAAEGSSWAATQPATEVPAGAAAQVPASAHVHDPWPRICDHFAMQLLVLAEQLRPEMDRLEADENDPDRLQQLYHVDHAVTRMRRAARDLRILAGGGEDLAGHITSLLDVIRMAQSSIEHYTQVSIGTVAELAVVAYVADDVASLLAALLDNATRYSPSTVTVSAHLLEDGGVLFRIEDAGIGIAPEQVASLNTALAGPIPAVGHRTGKHSGFPVVHRLASRHGIRVRLACRPPRGSGAPGGTLAMAAVPPQLLCEIPAPATDDEPVPFTAVRRPAPAGPGPAHTGPGPALPSGPGPARRPPEDSPATMATVNGLPRRRRTSLRGVDAGPRAAPEPVRAPDPSATRRSFAEDVSAFTAGSGDPRQIDPADDQEEQKP